MKVARHLAACLVLVVGALTSSQKNVKPVFQNPKAPITDRVPGLLQESLGVRQSIFELFVRSGKQDVNEETKT